MKQSSSLRNAKLATPGSEAIELTDIRGNVQNNYQSDDSISIGCTRQSSVVNMGFAHDVYESSDASLEVYGKPHMTPKKYVTPTDGTTGGAEGESSLEEATPGEMGNEWMDDFKEYDALDEDLDEDIDQIQKSDIGDCYICWKHKKCCGCLGICLLLLFLVGVIVLPKPLRLCVALSFDDENAMDKVPGDEGHFELEITNPNYIPVSINGFGISAYYGGVEEEKEVINVARSDYAIGAKNTLKTSNKTYVYAPNSAGAVPIAVLDSCSGGFRADLTYDLVASFKGCMMPFMCKSGIVLETSYVNSCLEEDEWVCTEFNILG